MCKQVICPNDGMPTWWGCARSAVPAKSEAIQDVLKMRIKLTSSGGHIEIALAGVPEAQRCQCEHVPVPGKPGVYEVAQGDHKKEGDAKVNVEMEN